MTGKRSMPQIWWARRETLLAVGGTALAVWLIAAAWMLFRPMGSEGGNVGPDQAPTQQQIVPTTPASSTEIYDPSPYTGKLNTPGFTPHPSPQGTGGATSGTSPTAGSSTTPVPTPAPSTSTPTPVHGHGHGHGHKP